MPSGRRGSKLGPRSLILSNSVFQNQLSHLEERDLGPPEETQVTIVDLIHLLKWTTKDVNLVLTPIFLARGEYTELDNFLESNYDHVLLSGQPGLGSCIYLISRSTM